LTVVSNNLNPLADISPSRNFFICQGAEVLQKQNGQPEQTSGRVQQPPGRVRQKVRGKFQKVWNSAHGKNTQQLFFGLGKINQLMLSVFAGTEQMQNRTSVLSVQVGYAILQ